jgi:hypothetical protein
MFLAALLLCACNANPPTVNTEPGQEIDLTPLASSQGRQWRRMNIDQLKSSLESVSGGIGWTENSPQGQTVNLFEQLAGSLGKPDYLNTNVEDLEPGMLFQKFLDDAATQVCNEWVERERTQPAQDRLLLVHAEFTDTPEDAPAAVEANMRHALLRFHGRPIVDGDPIVEPWLTLLGNIHEATGNMGTAWRGACVALFTHPDFYTF